jgi:hypothetical protein
MKNLLEKIFKRKKFTYVHFTGTSQKDKSGRYRYKIFVDGKLCKQDCYFEGWVKIGEIE